MKKQVFRAVGSVCAAGIMGFSAVCMSGCWSGKSELQIVTEDIPIGHINLWAAIGENKEAADVVYYRAFEANIAHMIVSVIDYHESLETYFFDGYCWLPLPMPENAEAFFNQTIEEYFSFAAIETGALDSTNGYWYYAKLQEGSGNNLSFIVDRAETYEFTDKLYEIAWYDTDLDRLYVVRKEWMR